MVPVNHLRCYINSYIVDVLIYDMSSHPEVTASDVNDILDAVLSNETVDRISVNGRDGLVRAGTRIQLSFLTTPAVACVDAFKNTSKDPQHPQAPK